jgi:hypothetical protein
MRQAFQRPRWWLLVIAGALAVPPVCCLVFELVHAGRIHTQFERLNIGMDTAQVQKIMGSPAEVESSGVTMKGITTTHKAWLTAGSTVWVDFDSHGRVFNKRIKREMNWLHTDYILMVRTWLGL